jgi:hemoglobin/transferrin/lactoferrin receptor protein
MSVGRRAMACSATARLTVQNLFDKDYKAYFNGFSAKGRSLKAAVSYTF